MRADACASHDTSVIQGRRLFSLCLAKVRYRFERAAYPRQAPREPPFASKRPLPIMTRAVSAAHLRSPRVFRPIRSYRAAPDRFMRRACPIPQPTHQPARMRTRRQPCCLRT